MKRIFCLAVALILASSASRALAEGGVEITGERTIGVRQIDLSPNSSKFNEYGDLRDGLFLQSFRLDVLDTRTGRYMDLSGRNLLRNDQSFRAEWGDLGRRWVAAIKHRQTPHRLSNKAMTPYIDRGNGLFAVAAPTAITKDGNPATGTPSLVPTAGEMAVNDDLVAAFLATHLRSADLGTQRDRTEGSLSLPGPERMTFRLTYSDERRSGSKITYGPIGDRPPRTLNVELAEPVDYATREVRADAEYTGDRLQTHVSYLFSLFDSRVEGMRWDNLYFAPDAGLDYVATVAGAPRNVARFGERSLAPDNHAHTVSFSGGLSLPRGSRLTAAAAFGTVRQNERLLPYSASPLGGDQNPATGDGLNWNDPGKLPRATADAEMRTLRLDGDYTVNPVAPVHLRAFLRYYDLDNRTPTAEWRYVTQDAAGTNGDVNYRNYRKNLAYAYEKLSLGFDARYYLRFWRTTLGLGYEREGIDRTFREADTDEDILRASVRAQPARRLSLSMGYLFGDRKGDGYDYNVTASSYWYSPAQGAADVDNPAFLFANHPDLRKYDVSDRRRNAFDVSATFLANDALSLTTAYRYRKDDFESGVTPVAPLAGTTVPLPNPSDADALTPGRQLGLLLEKRRNVTVDALYAPAGRWTFNVFADREYVDSDSRGMVFNENQRREPSNAGIQAPTSLGPWTDPDRLYDARTRQRTDAAGGGVGCEIIPGRLDFSTDFTLSRSRVNLDYAGYGADAVYLGRAWETFQFGFSNPETVRHNQYAVNSSLNCHLTDKLSMGLHYLYDRYRIQDWMQEPTGPWAEQVGSEFFLRDTSRDNRWGNRLISMGSTLAPDYDAQAVYATMTHRF